MLMYLWGSVDDSPQAVSHLSRDAQKLGSGLLCDATGFYRPRGYVQNMSEGFLLLHFHKRGIGTD